MSFTIEYLEFAMLVFVRVASIVSVTPFFGNNAVPVKVKIKTFSCTSLV